MIKFLLHPFNIFWVLFLISALAYFLKKDKIFRILLIASIAWLVITATPYLSHSLLSSLETDYSPLDINELKILNAGYHIIVLGGGHGFDDRLPPNSLLSLQALARLNEGIRLHLKLPGSKLVLSGFSSTPGRTTQAEMLQKTALLLGVSDTNIIVQKEPGNTFEEAQTYAATYGNAYPVILVTSASHMRRAVNSFTHFGIDVIPSPTHYRVFNPHNRRSWHLSSRNMENLRVALYEYLGMFYYEYFLK